MTRRKRRRRIRSQNGWLIQQLPTMIHTGTFNHYMLILKLFFYFEQPLWILLSIFSCSSIENFNCRKGNSKSLSLTSKLLLGNLNFSSFYFLLSHKGTENERNCVLIIIFLNRNNKQSEIYSNQSNDDDIDNMLKLESQKPKPTVSAHSIPPPTAADNSDDDDFVSGDEDEGLCFFFTFSKFSENYKWVGY